MQIIPLTAVPSQSLSVLLAGQSCQINVYTLATGLHLDLSVGNAPLMTTVLCRDRVKLVRQAYLGFVGDLVFMDTQDSKDPDYTGLGARYQFVYLEASDL